MKIGLIDVDGHGKRCTSKPYPNLALAKIAAYHKNLGDIVEWYEPLLGGGMTKFIWPKSSILAPITICR